MVTSLRFMRAKAGSLSELRCELLGVRLLALLLTPYLSSYALLNTILTGYTTFIEKQIIFEGKRRTFASRVRSIRASSPGRC